mmetsp:Transcript_40394/g.121697  ORF Transcript_40394/g.121697 Transcript_40394/m.121697 type:complete len:90 (-) Transcript_40394:5713-5982(-)
MMEVLDIDIDMSCSGFNIFQDKPHGIVQITGSLFKSDSEGPGGHPCCFSLVGTTHYDVLVGQSVQVSGWDAPKNSLGPSSVPSGCALGC